VRIKCISGYKHRNEISIRIDIRDVSHNRKAPSTFRIFQSALVKGGCFISKSKHLVQLRTNRFHVEITHKILLIVSTRLRFHAKVRWQPDLLVHCKLVIAGASLWPSAHSFFFSKPPPQKKWQKAANQFQEFSTFALTNETAD
jgi:hypothetical protein